MMAKITSNGKEATVTLPKWAWSIGAAIGSVILIGSGAWISWASVMLISHNSLAASMVTRMESQGESIKRIDSKIQQLDDRMFTTHQEN